MCFDFTVHSQGAVTRVEPVTAPAAGAVYFGGAKWKRVQSQIYDLYSTAQSCLTRDVYSITVDRLTQQFCMSTSSSIYKYKRSTCFSLKRPSSGPTGQE
jgi:hypothetical protein